MTSDYPTTLTTIERLKREGSNGDSIDCFERFGKRVALLYPLVKVEYGVRTPDGEGTLHRVITGEALVQLRRGKPNPRYTHNRKACVGLSAFEPEDLRPTEAS